MITAESSVEDVAKWLQEAGNGAFKELVGRDGKKLLGYTKEDLTDIIGNKAFALHNALHPTTGKADKFVCFFTDL